MWKKILISAVLIIAILAGLYWFKNNYQNKQETTAAPSSAASSASFEDKVYTYDVSALPECCQLNSEMACAVEFAVKCTLNPDFTGCRQSKLPKFIFMDDESLDRPTQMSFKIKKIKPVAADMVEIHTDSTCNGNWFGLCQGNIIYVLVPDGESWRVKDIYAIEI